MTTPNDDLRSLIDAASAKPSSPKRAPVRTAAPTGPAPATTAPGDDIRALLQQAAGGAGQTAAARGTLSVFKNPTVIAGMVALVMVILALGWWKTSQPALSGPPATLQQLANSVEQYRLSRNGRLPEQLSNLEHFPKVAVEWQLRHWKARDARGRTEIFWAPNGSKHYRIVLRQGSSVWVYNDLDGKSRQTQP